jgi:hypothetical protein
MSSKVPYRINEIDVDNICYTNIKSNSKKTIVYLNYMDSTKFKNFVFQSPTLLSSNDIICKNNLYELDLPLNGKSDSKVSKFVKFLNSIDNKIIKDAKNNHQWFSHMVHQPSIKYQKIIRESTDDSNTNGVIRIKLLKTNDFETRLNLNNKKIAISDVPKNCWIKMILEVYAIWINENGFGLFIRPILLDFKPINKISYNYNIIDDSDENEDDGIDCIQDTIMDTKDSVFIRSENEITSSVLEIPNDSSSDTDNDEIVDSVTSDTA